MTSLAHRVALRRPSLHSLAQAGRFCVVGASGYVVNLLVFRGLLSLGAGHRAAAVGAFLVAVANNFLWNRRWTFKAQGSAGRFLAVSVAAFVVALGLLEGLIALGVAPVIAQAVSIVVVTPISYAGNRAWTFRTRER